MMEVSETEMQSLVQCIPESVPSAELGVWLSHSIVPFILQHLSQSLVRMTNSMQLLVLLIFTFILGGEQG